MMKLTVQVGRSFKVTLSIPIEAAWALLLFLL